MKKSQKNVRLAQRYPESPLPLVQCCAKAGKTVQGSGWPNDQANLQPTLTKGAGDASLTKFVTDCSLFLNCPFLMFIKLANLFSFFRHLRILFSSTAYFRPTAMLPLISVYLTASAFIFVG